MSLGHFSLCFSSFALSASFLWEWVLPMLLCLKWPFIVPYYTLYTGRYFPHVQSLCFSWKYYKLDILCPFLKWRNWNPSQLCNPLRSMVLQYQNANTLIQHCSPRKQPTRYTPMLEETLNFLSNMKMWFNHSFFLTKKKERYLGT